MYQCERCGKCYTQKKNLKKHLNSKKVCETKLSDISRELLLDKKNLPSYNKVAVKKKLPKKKPAADLAEAAKLNPICIGKQTPWVDKDIEIDPSYQYGANVYQYAARQFYNNFKDIIYVHKEGDCIELLYDKNLILCFTAEQVVYHLLYPFYDMLREKLQGFEHMCNKKIDKGHPTDVEIMMYRAFKDCFKIHINKVNFQHFNLKSNIELY